MKKKEKVGICTYCRKKKVLERDHIPSRTLFPDSYDKKNLVTVPSCRRCNAYYSKYEENFRNDITYLSVEDSEHAEEIFSTKIRRYIERSPKKKRETLKRMRSVGFFSEEGHYIEEKTEIKMGPRIWQRHFKVIDKYIRGLIHKELGDVLPACYQMKHIYLSEMDDKYLKIINKWNLDHSKIFIYGYSRLPNSFNSIWITAFFNRVIFVSSVAPWQIIFKMRIQHYLKMRWAINLINEIRQRLFSKYRTQ